MVVEAVVVVEVLVVVVVEVVMVVEVDKAVGEVVVLVVGLLPKTPKPTTEASTANPIIALRAKRTEYGENIQLRFFELTPVPAC